MKCVFSQDKDWSISVELRPCQSGQSGTCLNSVTLLLNSVSDQLPTAKSNQLRHTFRILEIEKERLYYVN